MTTRQSLGLQQPKKSKTRPCIANFILKDPLLDLVVKSAALECYLHHLSDRLIAEPGLARIGRVKSLLRLAGPDPDFYQLETDEGADTRRMAVVADAYQLVDELNFEVLQLSDLNLDPVLFLEYLINCIRNDVISYQTFISKIFKNSKHNQTRQINQLKTPTQLINLGLRNWNQG